MTAQDGLRGWTLITDASEGLGRDFAILAAAEARDLILAVRPGAKLDALADELRQRHKIAVEILVTDLSDTEAVELLWRRASTRRRIDILVNQAGLAAKAPLTAEGLGRKDPSNRDDVLALTILTGRAVPHMLAAGGGRILNVAVAMPGQGATDQGKIRASVLAQSKVTGEEMRGSKLTITAFFPRRTGADNTAASRPSGLTPLPGARSAAKTGWLAMKAGRRICAPGLMNRLSAQFPWLGPRH